MDFNKFRKTFREELYDRYSVRMQLVDLAGGIPASSQMIEGWINATNKKRTEEERQALKEATAEELPNLADEKANKSWCRFKRDETGPYLEGRCVKAGLKESANIVKNLVKVPGKDGEEKKATALKSKFAECVFIDETKVYLRDTEGVVLTGELDTEERPVHVIIAQGPRTALKRVDVARNVVIEFTISLAKTGAVTERALYSALTYLERGGLGSDRSQGRGVGEVLSVEKLT